MKLATGAAGEEGETEMKPLLTMSEPDLTHALMQIPRTDAPDAVRIALGMLASELDAQRAEPTREPGEAEDIATLRADRDKWYRVCDEAWTALDGSTWSEPDEGLARAITKKINELEKAQVDAATIRRQVLDEAIVAMIDLGFIRSGMAIRALEALRDPADAREAGKE